jgi:transcriptional regulator with XRE-family HTH domain
MKKQINISAYTGRIRYIRERVLGLSGERFGDLLGISQDTVSTWERGIRRPKGDALIKVAELGNCSVDWILTGKGSAPGGYPEEIFGTLDARSLGERMVYLREKGLKLSRKELGARLDISEARVSDYERGELVPPMSILKSFAEISGVSLSFIASGTSEEEGVVSPKENRINELEKRIQMLEGLVAQMHGTGRESAGVGIATRNSVQAKPKIPVLADLPVTYPIKTTSDNVIDWLWVPGNASIDTENDSFGIRIKDESMAPELIPGDYALVVPQKSARDHDMIVCTVKGNAMIRLFESIKGNTTLRPSNPEYPSITVAPEDDFQVIGKVFAIGFRELHRYTKPLSK